MKTYWKKSLTKIAVYMLSALMSCSYFCQIANASSSQGDLDYTQLHSQQVENPNTLNMAADMIIARPLLLGATVVGTGLFIVSLPFSLLGGNVKQAGDQLVMVPAKATFTRCLGCRSNPA